MGAECQFARLLCVDRASERGGGRRKRLLMIITRATPGLCPVSRQSTSGRSRRLLQRNRNVLCSCLAACGRTFRMCGRRIRQGFRTFRTSGRQSRQDILRGIEGRAIEGHHSDWELNDDPLFSSNGVRQRRAKRYFIGLNTPPCLFSKKRTLPSVNPTFSAYPMVCGGVPGPAVVYWGRWLGCQIFNAPGPVRRNTTGQTIRGVRFL